MSLQVRICRIHGLGGILDHGETAALTLCPFTRYAPRLRLCAFCASSGMHRLGLYTLCILYILLRCVSVNHHWPLHDLRLPSYTAAPVSSTSPSVILVKTSTSSHSDTNTGSTASHSTSLGTHGPHISSHTSPFSFSHHPQPTSTTPSSSTQHSHHRIRTMTILGIVFGGLAGFVLVLSVARCWWSWRKTPSRDRIASLMHRYNLEREMEQATVEPLRARVRRPPPPPYRHPPPGYDSVMPSSPPAAHLELPVEAVR